MKLEVESMKYEVKYELETQSSRSRLRRTASPPCNAWLCSEVCRDAVALQPTAAYCVSTMQGMVIGNMKCEIVETHGDRNHATYNQRTASFGVRITKMRNQ